MSGAGPSADAEPLAGALAPLRDDLDAVERILSVRLHSRHAFLDELTRRVRVYHGKRVRPTLLLLSAQACGGIQPSHHVLAAVLEMIHVATLVHDDLLDDADVRRHVPTVNAEWGKESSLLLGDYLFSQAYHLASTLDEARACRTIGEATNRTCEGELRQVARRGDFDLSEEDYLDIIASKTAELIACACRLGAEYAGAGPDDVEALAHYGRSLGAAFQIADDLLDLLGRSDQTGKPIGADWAKRKMTLPWIRFRDSAEPEQVRQLRSLFEAESDRRAEAVELLAGSNAIESARNTARRFVEQAEAALDRLPPSNARDHLRWFASFAVNRVH